MDWKVFKTKVKVFSHFNAEALEIVRAGDYQFVVQKGIYQDDSVAFVVPEKSILPEHLKQHWINYLKGSEKNRVGTVTLRGEISQGIIISTDIAESIGIDTENLPFDEDVSSKLGITKYEPPIPINMAGEMVRIPADVISYVNYFDCVNYASFYEELKDEDMVVITEKLHGSQINIIIQTSIEGDKSVFISTKGILKKNNCGIKESASNLYWQAYENTISNHKIITDLLPGTITQVIGEVIPCQKGYSYGQSKPIVKVFKIFQWDVSAKQRKFILHNYPELMVPVITIQEYGKIKETIRDYAKGMECVSGKSFHIREGVVVSKESASGKSLKIINPKYKETGEEFS